MRWGVSCGGSVDSGGFVESGSGFTSFQVISVVAVEFADDSGGMSC